MNHSLDNELGNANSGTTYSSENTPTRTPAPTQVHPIASPHVSGLRAPQNTPHTRPSSPHIMPAHLRTHNEEVGLALSDFVNNMEDGKPLSESYWAPANVAARAAAALDSRPASRNLIPTNIVKPNPAINDTFDRMSFRAADFDSKVGNNIFGDRISRPATSVLGAKQTLGSPASSKSTVQPSIPVGAGPSGQSSNISITKAANWVNRTLSKASGSAVKNSQKAIPAPQDDGLVSRLSALECFGRLDPGQINFLKDITNKVVADKAQPTTATTSAQAVAEKPTGNTADKSAKANGVQITVEESTGRIFVGNAEQVEALVKKLSLKEKELKALKEITELRESLCLKEEEWKNFNAVWEEKENKLQKDVTELQAELARVEDLISLKQRESVALSASNAGRGVVMTKAIQDMRHELHLKEEKFNDADALSARKQAGLEKEVKELQKELQRMEATKKEKSKVEVSLKAVESAKDEGILEHKTFFNAWPLSEKRDRARK